MAVVKEVRINVNDEVTDVVLLKGNTRETVKRHVTSLIPILSRKEATSTGNDVLEESSLQENNCKQVPLKVQKDQCEDRTKRKAALVSRERTKEILSTL